MSRKEREQSSLEERCTLGVALRASRHIPQAHRSSNHAEGMIILEHQRSSSHATGVTLLESRLRRDAPQASHYFSLRIADITIAIFSDDPELRLEANGATKKFLIEAANPDARVRADWGNLSAESSGQKIFDSGAPWQLYCENGSYLFRLFSFSLGPIPYKVARFNRDFSQGMVSLHRPHFDPVQIIYPLEYPLDELLLINLLALDRGVEIHACGVVDSSGRGHLFVGQSEAGKTTMARLWQNVPGVTVLSDDRIILRKVNESFWMYGTPWHGEAMLASPDRAQLSRVYFLSKGTKNELLPLRKSDAAGRLFACSFPPFYSRQGVGFTLGFLTELVQSIPCYELRFLPDESVLEFLITRERFA